MSQTASISKIAVNCEAELFIQDFASYQNMMDELAHARFVAAMRESEASVNAGLVQDVDAAFADVRSQLGFSTQRIA